MHEMPADEEEQGDDHSSHERGLEGIPQGICPDEPGFNQAEDQDTEEAERR